MSEFKIGVIGCGKYGTKRALSISSEFKNTSIKVVFDTDLENAKQLGTKLNSAYTSDITEFFEQVDLNIVLICVPNKYHIDYSILALKNNCHVLCEKPLSNNLSQVKELEQVIKTSRKYFQVGSNFEHFPSMKSIQDILEKKQLGRIFNIDICIGHNGDMTSHTWNSISSYSGGGTFIDNGIHAINFLHKTCGELELLNVENVSFSKKEIEDDLTVNFLHDLTQISLRSSWKKQNGYSQIKIKGEFGEINHDIFDDNVEIIYMGGKKELIDSRIKTNSLVNEFSSFLENISQGKCSLESFNHSVNNLEAIMEVYATINE